MLTGVVTDQASGLPLPGATVVVTDSAGHVYTTTADINGRYVFTGTPAAPLVPGNATVAGSAPGYGSDVQTKSLVGGTTNVQDLQLPPTVLTGVVTDQATGLPLPGATVVVTDSAGHVYTTTADINGRYVFTGTPAAPLDPGNATVVGNAPGYGADVQTKSLTSGTTNTQDLQLPPTVLTGVVTDQATGLPLPGATVVVTDSAGHVYTTTADLNGRYVFTGTPAAPLASATPRSPAAPPAITWTWPSPPSSAVRPTSRTCSCRPPSSPAWSDGVVYIDVDGDGVYSPTVDIPQAGITVVVTDTNGVTYTLTTNAGGYFSQTVPAGPTVVDVDQSGLPPGVGLTIGSTDPTTVVVPPNGIATDNTGYARILLELSKIVAPGQPATFKHGDDIRFTIIVTNASVISVTNVLVTENIPDGLVLSPNDNNGWTLMPGGLHSDQAHPRPDATQRSRVGDSHHARRNRPGDDGRQQGHRDGCRPTATAPRCPTSSWKRTWM